MNYLYKISYAHLQWLIVVFKLEVKLRVQAVTTLYIYINCNNKCCIYYEVQNIKTLHDTRIYPNSGVKTTVMFGLLTTVN